MEIQSLVDSISKLTLIEASELVKALEKTLGVSAAPVASAAAAAPRRLRPRWPLRSPPSSRWSSPRPARTRST